MMIDWTRQLTQLVNELAECVNNWLCGQGNQKVEITSPNHPDPAAAVFFKGKCFASEASLILRPDMRGGWFLTNRYGRRTFWFASFAKFQDALRQEKKRKQILLKTIEMIAMSEDKEKGSEMQTALTRKEEDFCDRLCEQLSTLGYTFTRGTVEVLDEMRGRLHVGFFGPNTDPSKEASVSFYVSRDSRTHRYEICNTHGDGGTFQDLSELVAWFVKIAER
jgi:hypothetical protein